MNVSKQTRYWVRRLLFVVMLGLVGYALYQSVAQGEGNRPEPGRPAPVFQLTTLDGKEVSLEDYKGKAVMLNFWGSWCEPCTKEMPALQTVYEKYKNQGFVVLGINIAETDFTANAFANRMGISFPVLMDRQRDVVKLYDVVPIPSSFFIDPEGTLKQRVEAPLTVEQLEPIVQSILPKK
ncbi:peroxiredoxin [Laceyella sacchari]|nr:peroxiredoxin [Laceyella sacchari]